MPAANRTCSTPSPRLGNSTRRSCAPSRRSCWPSGPEGPFDYVVPAVVLTIRDDRSGSSSRAGACACPLAAAIAAVVGYCVEVGDKPVDARRLKPIAGVVDSQSLLSPAMLRLTRWMADYYLCPWGQVLEAVVPGRRAADGRDARGEAPEPPCRTRATKFAELKLRSPQQRKALEELAGERRPLTAAELAEAVGCTLAPIKAL